MIFEEVASWAQRDSIVVNEVASLQCADSGLEKEQRASQSRGPV